MNLRRLPELIIIIFIIITFESSKPKLTENRQTYNDSCDLRLLHWDE